MTRIVIRWLLVVAYLIAGVAHVARPETFLAIMPGWVPFPAAVVYWTGVAEIFGALALAPGWSLRRLAGWGLAAYALCVWPANVNHMVLDQGARLAYHIPRMFAQPLLIWAALWASGAIDWPWRREPHGAG